MEDNLIKRTLAHLKTKLQSSKIVKRVGALALSAAIAASFSACSCNPNKPDPSIDPIYSCEECGGEHKTSEHEKVIESKYSNLMKSILANEEYANWQDLGISSDPDKIKEEYALALNQHPYTFLADQGYDVSAIKNGSLSCITYSFVLDKQPNRLYMVVKVEDKEWTSPRVYINYLISYDLSEKEITEYRRAYNQRYIMANFLNNEISKQKKPTIHHTSTCTIAVSNNLIEAGDRARYKGYSTAYTPYTNKTGEVYYISGDMENCSMDVLIFRPIAAYFCTAYPGRYVSIYEDRLLTDFSFCGLNPKKEDLKSYDCTYFNKMMNTTINGDYKGRRGYSLNRHDFNPDSVNIDNQQ